MSSNVKWRDYEHISSHKAVKNTKPNTWTPVPSETFISNINHLISNHLSREEVGAEWHFHITSAYWDHKFEINLGYIARHCLKKANKKER